MNIKAALLKDKTQGILIDSGAVYSQNYILNICAEYLANKVNFIQFYVKNFKDSENIETAFKLRQLCSMYSALFIINSRIDIAKLVKADGICLFEGDLTVQQIRKVTHDDLIIGFCPETIEGLISIQNENIDYIGLNTNIDYRLEISIKALNKVKVIKLDRCRA